MTDQDAIEMGINEAACTHAMGSLCVMRESKFAEMGVIKVG